MSIKEGNTTTQKQPEMLSPIGAVQPPNPNQIAAPAPETLRGFFLSTEFTQRFELALAHGDEEDSAILGKHRLIGGQVNGRTFKAISGALRHEREEYPRFLKIHGSLDEQSSYGLLLFMKADGSLDEQQPIQATLTSGTESMTYRSDKAADNPQVAVLAAQAAAEQLRQYRRTRVPTAALAGASAIAGANEVAA